MIYLLLFLVLWAIGLFVVWRHVRKHKAHHIVDQVTFLVTMPKEIFRQQDDANANQPKDFKEALAPTEQFFASLSSTLKRDLAHKLTGEQDIMCFEMVVEGNLVSFYVSCPGHLASLLERQLYSFFPKVSVERATGHNIFQTKGMIAAATLEFTKRFIFPIRTFKYLEADPINNLTGAFAKLGDKSAAAIQILIKPLDEGWRVHPAIAAKHVLEGKTGYIYRSPTMRVVHELFEAFSGGVAASAAGRAGPESSGNKSWRLTPVQEDLMKAFNEKGSKPGFKTVIRIVAVGPDAMTAQAHRDNIVSAFSQFATPAWNGFKPIIARDSAQVATDFIFRTFDRAKSLIMNSEELASLFHLPNRYTDTPNIRWMMSKVLAPPPNLPREGTVIGESVYRGETNEVRIKPPDRLRHIFMIGKTGVGKTTLFENMIEQDIRSGAGCCFIDPLGDAIESILAKIPKERAEDVILFDPSDTERPVGLNLLEWKRPEEKDFLIQEWIEIFYKLYDPNRTGIVGPQFEHWGRNAALTVMNLPEGGSLIEIPRLFTDDSFRERAVSFVTDPVVRSFWEQQLAKTADFHKSEMYNYFISKFGRFMTNDLMRNIIGQAKSGFDMRKLMDDRKILLVNLSKGKIGEMNSYLLGMIIIAKLQTAAFSRADTPEEERRDFYVYVDEFQNFTTDSFATILSEARKYHIGLHITNQYIAQLTEKIRDSVVGNAGTLISYRIGASDAEFMVKEFPGVSIDDLANLDRFSTYVKLLIDGTPSKPFSMRGIKSPVVKDKQMAEATRQLSRLSYGKDRKMIESELTERTKPASVPTGSNEPLVKV
ncbi:MAG: ATP-binding protein [Patescibacteria group bacterium]